MEDFKDQSLKIKDHSKLQVSIRAEALRMNEMLSLALLQIAFFYIKVIQGTLSLG